MKKIWLASVVILIASLAFGASIPAPFEKAKEIALKGNGSSDKGYVVTFEIGANADRCIYLIGYLPKKGLIGVGKIVGSLLMVAEYNEKTFIYTGYIYDGNKGERQEIKKEQAEQFVFSIFRELVAKGLI